MTGPKYPELHVKLTGRDGNAFMIMGRVGPVIRKAHGKEAEKEFLDEAMSGDYAHLLRTCGEWVTIS